PVLVEQMGEPFPELKANADRVQKVLRDEEAEFLKTIQRGLVHFAEAAENAKYTSGLISGQTACDLHTTYGFPVDLTEQMAEEFGLRVDRQGFEVALEEHRRISRQGQKKLVVTAVQG